MLGKNSMISFKAYCWQADLICDDSALLQIFVDVLNRTYVNLSTLHKIVYQ
jgi:hypothetical protein